MHKRRNYGYPDADTIKDLTMELLGRTIVRVEECTSADEGIYLVLDNGTKLIAGFSGCEGFIHVLVKEE